MSLDAGSAHEGDLEDVGTGEASKRIGNAPTTTDVDDPERSSRNTASGSGAQPGDGPVQTDPGDDATDVDPEGESLGTSNSIQPHLQGEV